MKLLVTAGAGFIGRNGCQAGWSRRRRFLLVICPAERPRAVHESLADMREFPVGWITSARAPSSTCRTTTGAEPG